MPGYADRYFQSKESVFALLRICSIRVPRTFIYKWHLSLKFPTFTIATGYRRVRMTEQEIWRCSDGPRLIRGKAGIIRGRPAVLLKR